MSEAISAQNIERILEQRLLDLNATVDTQEVSFVAEVGDGIAHVAGLQRAMAGLVATLMVFFLYFLLNIV